MPGDITRIDAGAFVAEVVMKPEMTPFLAAATGYLASFSFPQATPEELRGHAAIEY